MTEPFADIEKEDSVVETTGYKQSLYRGLDGLMSFTVGYTEVAGLLSITSMFTYGLSTGGPVTMVRGWVLSSIMTVIVALCMAEICCAYPSAGSVYNWAGQLAPREYAPLASYWAGIANWLGNAAGDASFAAAFATFVSAACEVAGLHPLSNRDQVIVSIGILLLWSILNFFRIDQVGSINNIGALVILGTTLAVLISVLTMAPSLNSPGYVFFHFNNDSGFSGSYTLVISLLFSLFSFSGYEASAHLAEETQGSRTNAPMGIVYTVVASGVGGLVYILALLFAVQSLPDAVDSSSGNAAVEIFVQATNRGTAFILTSLVVLNAFFAGVSSVAVTGRITFALVRDKAIPFHETLARVDHRFQSPVNAILFVFVFDAILLLMPLTAAGATAFYSLVGICTIGFQVSYGIPIALKFFCASEGGRLRPFPHTPMSLGAWSAPLGLVATVWLFGTSLVFFFPTEYPITAANMNYTVVVVGLIVVSGMLNWVFISRHYFKGPMRHNDVDISATASDDKINQHKSDSVDNESLDVSFGVAKETDSLLKTPFQSHLRKQK